MQLVQACITTRTDEAHYIQLLRTVADSVKKHCTKGEVKFVTNRIISDFRRNKIFGMNVVDFDVDVTPVDYPEHPRGIHRGNVRLNKGVTVYYGVAYD